MSGGGGSPQSVTQTSKNEPPAYLQPYLTDIAQRAQTNYLSNSPQYYQNSTVAPQSQATQQAIQSTINLASQPNGLLNSAVGQTQNMINGDFLSPNSNPYLRASVDYANQPVIDNYRNVVAPGIDARFSAAGRYGSEAHNTAQTSALDSLNRAITGNSASMYGGAYNTERGYQNAAIGSAPTINQARYGDIANLASAGAQQDAYNQALTNADIQKWNYNQNLDANKLGQYSGLIYGQNNGGINTTTSQVPMSGSGLGQMLGLGISGLGTLGSLFGSFGPFAGMLASDRRLKTDIHKVGETSSGTNIYTYRYKGDPSKTTHMGVMAQEVRKANPEAVKSLGGLLAVDYSKVA